MDLPPTILILLGFVFFFIVLVYFIDKNIAKDKRKPKMKLHPTPKVHFHKGKDKEE